MSHPPGPPQESWTDAQWSHWVSTGGGGASEEVESILGRLLLDPISLQPIGVFRVETFNGVELVRFFDPQGNPAAFPGGGLDSARLLTETGQVVEVNRRGELLGEPIDRDDFFRLFTAGQAGGGTGGLSFEQQRQLAEESREFAAKESALARENQQRLSLLSQGTRLASDAASLKQQATSLLAQTIGDKPLVAAALLQGRLPPTSGTPSQVFRSELEQTQQLQTPQLDFFGQPIPDLEAGLGQFQHEVETGLPTRGFGLGHGGTIDMERGGDGVFGAKAVLVGDDPSGRGREAPEVLDFSSPGRIRVIPLRGSMAHGGEISLLTEEGLPRFDPNTLGQTFAPLFQELGFASTPRLSPDTSTGLTVQQAAPGNLGAAGLLFGDVPNTLQSLQGLGIQPSLVRNSATGEVFFRTPEGTLRPLLGGFERFGLGAGGIDEQNVVNVDPASLAGAPIGAPIRGPADLQGAQPQGISPLGGALPAVRGLGADLGGFLAPNPSTIANLFRRLPRTTQLLVEDAIEMAFGFSPEQQADLRSFATPRGTGRLGGATLG